MDPAFRETRVTTNGISLHVIEAGPPEAAKQGRLVILLHGFPEFWFGWRKQLGALAAEGYFVVAPDQRGYNLSDKPAALRAYRIDELARDVVGLVDHYAGPGGKGTVVGHDWGGAAAWWVANRYPERVERLCVLNCPHHRVLRRSLKNNPRQLARSWYMFFFQLPRLPELGLRALGGKLLERGLTKTSRPETFKDEELERYREAWRRRGALTGMVNWYRALRFAPPRPASARITVPTLLVWGTRDRFLGTELVRPSIDLCDDGRVELIEGASHWVQHEEPERVNELLLEFCQHGNARSPEERREQWAAKA